MKTRANGIEMNFEFSGKKGAPVVILSHALGADLSMWEPQVESLERDFRVLRYDVRGHGKSQSTTGPYTLELLAQDAVRLLDALEIEKVHWVGISMGGMIGQSIGLNYPDRLISLALCDTSALVPAEAQPVLQERIDTVRREGLQAIVNQTIERWFSPNFQKENTGQLLNVRERFLRTSVEGYLGCSEAVRRLNYLEQLSKITVPVLIIVGEDDQGTPVSASEAMHAKIRGSKLAILKACRHFSNMEQSEEFNRIVVSFLKSVPNA